MRRRTGLSFAGLALQARHHSGSRRLGRGGPGVCRRRGPERPARTRARRRAGRQAPAPAAPLARQDVLRRDDRQRLRPRNPTAPVEDRSAGAEPAAAGPAGARSPRYLCPGPRRRAQRHPRRADHPRRVPGRAGRSAGGRDQRGHLPAQSRRRQRLRPHPGVHPRAGEGDVVHERLLRGHAPTTSSSHGTRSASPRTRASSSRTRRGTSTSSATGSTTTAAGTSPASTRATGSTSRAPTTWWRTT